jgi:benzoate membrane transport protein
VAAFVLAGVLVVLTGAVKPLGQLVARIPDGVAAAMLAGVLLPFCLKAALSAQTAPALILPMVVLFVLVRLVNPALAVLAALGMGLALAFATGAASLPPLTLPWPALTFIAPEFNASVLLGLGVPIYLVTMASQNLPGFATLRAAGYEPPVRPALLVTGTLSAVIALFAGHMVNMAAITAAICLGDDVHPDRRQRWTVGLAYAGFWVLLGVLAPAIITLLAALPPQVMVALVGLALLGPLMGALSGAFAMPDQRFAAVVTLTVTGSGVAAFGIGAAFWGLAAGLSVHAVERLRARVGAGA